MTIAAYLQILDNYVLNESTISRILVKCNKEYGFDIEGPTAVVGDMTIEQLDLCEAWTWVYACGIVSMNGGAKKSVGNRSVSYASYSPFATDKKNWIERANAIFRKYGKAEVRDADEAQIDDRSLYWSNGRT